MAFLTDDAPQLLYDAFTASSHADEFKRFGAEFDPAMDQPSGEVGGIPIGMHADGNYTEVFHLTLMAVCEAIGKSWQSYAEGFIVPVLPMVGGVSSPGPAGTYSVAPMVMWTPGMLIPTKTFNSIKSNYTHPLPTNHAHYSKWEHVLKILDTAMTTVGVLYATTFFIPPPLFTDGSGSGWFLGPFAVPLPGPVGPPPALDNIYTLSNGLSAGVAAAAVMKPLISTTAKALLIPKYMPTELPHSSVPAFIDGVADAISSVWFDEWLTQVEFSGGMGSGLTAPFGATVGVVANITVTIL